MWALPVSIIDARVGGDHADGTPISRWTGDGDGPPP
jgi:hypothetical protein